MAVDEEELPPLHAWSSCTISLLISTNILVWFIHLISSSGVNIYYTL